MAGAALDRCCFCCNLRKGVLSLGVLYIILSVILVILYGIQTGETIKAKGNYLENAWTDNKIEIRVTHGVTIFRLVVWAINVITSVILLDGVHKDKKYRLVPWMLACGITVSLHLYDVVGLLTQREVYDASLLGIRGEAGRKSGPQEWDIMSPVQVAVLRCVQIVLEAYFLWCVGSLYRSLRGKGACSLEMCCYCCDLEKGIKAFSILWAILFLVMAIMLGCEITEWHGFLKKCKYNAWSQCPEGHRRHVMGVTLGFMIFSLMLCVCHIVSSVVMFFAVKLGKKILFIPWVTIALITCSFLVFLTFTFIHLRAGEKSIDRLNISGIISGGVILLSFQLYFLWCVSSMIRKLNGEVSFSV